MINDADKKTLMAIAAAKGASFVELARIAGLDPRSAFRGADLRDVDFQECDLDGFDFTHADLSGATFKGASLKGAIFSEIPLASTLLAAQPTGQQPTAEADRKALTADQQHLLDLMREALDERGRALALMPTGTGRSAVLVELIAQTVPNRSRAALVVTSAAEREQMIARLQERLPGQLVMSSRDARETPGWTGVIVHSASAYDNNFRALLEATFSDLDFLFSTSLERLHGLTRAADGLLGFVRTAVFDTPLIDIGSRDFDRQNRLVRELFGKPTIDSRIDEALKSGQLIEAKIVQPNVPGAIPPARAMFSSSVQRPGPEELLRQLEPVTAELVEILHAMRPQSLLVLCRDAPQSKVVYILLGQLLHDADGIRPASPRWSAEKIRSELESKGGIVVAPLSHQSLDAARLLPNVAVFTPMRLALAQELAFRPSSPFSQSMVPLVIDFAGAFTGFPSVDTVMRLGQKTSSAALSAPRRRR